MMKTKEKEIFKITCKNWTRIYLYVNEEKEIMCEIMNKDNTVFYLTKSEFKDYYKKIEDEHVKKKIIEELEEHKKDIEELLELINGINGTNGTGTKGI